MYTASALWLPKRLQLFKLRSTNLKSSVIEYSGDDDNVEEEN